MLTMPQVAGWVRQWVGDWFLRKVGSNTYTGTLTVDDTIITPLIKALNANGLQLKDDSGTLGLTVADGGFVGITTATPGTLGASYTYPSGSLLHVGGSTWGQLALSGSSGAQLDLFDTGGGSNTKWFSTLVSSDTVKLYANTDAGAVSKTIMVYDLATGNVGIGGTPVSGSNLTIEGATSSIVYLKDANAAADKKIVKWATNSHVQYFGRQTDAGADIANDLVIDASGNVGVGGTPSYPLDLQTTDPDPMRIYNSSATGYAQILLKASGRQYQVGVGGASVSGVADRFFIYDPVAVVFRFVLNSSGNIGIGTTDIETWNTSYRAFQLGSRPAIMWNSSNSGIYIADNAYYATTNTWKYRVTATSHMVQVDSNGITLNAVASGTADTAITYHVGLKQTTTETTIYGNESTDAILQIFADQGDDNADKWRIRVTNSSGSSPTTSFLHIENYATGAWVDTAVLGGYSSGGPVAYLPGSNVQTTALSANVNTSNATYNGYLARSTSSRKYKTNIRKLPPVFSGELLMKLEPVLFNSLCEIDPKDVDYVGFIAEDLYDLGASPFLFYDESGKPDGVQYDRLVVSLVSAYQEMERRLKKLEENKWQ